MTRKELQELGLTKEQIISVIKINGKDIEHARSTSAARIRNLEEAVSGLNGQIGEQEAQLESIKIGLAIDKILTIFLSQIPQTQHANKGFQAGSRTSTDVLEQLRREVMAMLQNVWTKLAETEHA